MWWAQGRRPRSGTWSPQRFRPPPPDFRNAEFQNPAFRNQDMSNFELDRKRSRKRWYLLCCLISVGVIFLIGLIATPTAISIAGDGEADLLNAVQAAAEEEEEFFSCFILRRSDTAVLNDTTSTTHIEFKQEFCNSMLNSIDSTLDLSCDITGFRGDPTVVNYKVVFLAQSSNILRPKIIEVIIQAMSAGFLENVPINNRTNVTQLTDGVAGNSNCLLDPLPMTTTIQSSSSAVSLETSSTSTFETSSILTLETSSTSTFETSSPLTLETSSSSTFETSSLAMNSTSIIPSTMNLVENSTFSMMITPSPSSITPSCTAHDEGTCEHSHESDFSHAGRCYVWYRLLVETGLWNADGMRTYHTLPFEGHCYDHFLHLLWPKFLDENEREKLHEAKEKATDDARFLSPEEAEPFVNTSGLPDCDLMRRNSIRCYSWWAILTDASWDTFFYVVFEDLQDFEGFCFDNTFNDTDEARDIMFLIEEIIIYKKCVAANATDPDNLPGFCTCTCGFDLLDSDNGPLPSIPSQNKLRKTMRCWAWWVHLYTTGLWNYDGLTSTFMKNYEFQCVKILGQLPFLSPPVYDSLKSVKKLLKKQINGTNLDEGSPVEEFFLQGHCSSSNITTGLPTADDRDNYKKCYLWWWMAMDEDIWDVVDHVSEMNSWELWCYSQIIDGSFEVEDHHHHHF